MSKRHPISGPPRDVWDTPPEAVAPLLPFLPFRTAFEEPCAGRGALVEALTSAGHICSSAFDIAPRDPSVTQRDALHVQSRALIITNPPWSRPAFEPLMNHWIKCGCRGWLLIPLDWLANIWTAPLVERISQIVPVGRVSWLGNGTAGKDNCTWVRFGVATDGPVRPRAKRSVRFRSR